MWDKLKEQFNLLKLERKKLYLITNSDKFQSKEEFLDAVASSLQGGVDIIQFNEKNIPDNVNIAIGHKLRFLCDEFGATYIVNNRVDIAKITEADGVHLEEGSLSIRDAKSILGENAIIGKTISNIDEALIAVQEGVDYLILQNENLDLTNLKEFFNVESYDEIRKNIDIPLFVSGNITLSSIESFVENNDIHKIVVTDAIMYAKVPELAARKFLSYL